LKSIEYFKTKLMQLKTNKNVIRVFQGAEKKECKNYLKKECKTVIWEDKENVRNYYHIAKGLLEQYEKTGKYAVDDNKELGNALYKYYLVLEYICSISEFWNQENVYTEQYIDRLIEEFEFLADQINKYLIRKMMSD
jgi:ribosome recycling factor